MQIIQFDTLCYDLIAIWKDQHFFQRDIQIFPPQQQVLASKYL